MQMRAEVVGWKHLRNPQKRLEGVSVVIVLGGRESRPHGEGPQLIRCLKVLLHRMLSPVHSGRCRWNGNEGNDPDGGRRMR